MQICVDKILFKIIVYILYIIYIEYLYFLAKNIRMKNNTQDQ